MLYDAVREDEIFEAFMLYTSLRGMETDAEAARERIAKYLDNQPDVTLDQAILAFAEDRILAPPDVVIPRWGRSRVYELVETQLGQWRHQVSESWFENGCCFYGDQRDAGIVHYWTRFTFDAPGQQRFPSAARLSLKLLDQQIEVQHREIGLLGRLPSVLASEICSSSGRFSRYLCLHDPEPAGGQPQECRLLVARAENTVATSVVVKYLAQAYEAERNEC